MATRVMGDVVSCIILLLIQVYDLNSAEKISEYYVLECLREHRVYFVVYSMPNYGGDNYGEGATNELLSKGKGLLVLCSLRYLLLR